MTATELHSQGCKTFLRYIAVVFTCLVAVYKRGGNAIGTETYTVKSGLVLVLPITRQGGSWVS